MLQGQRTAMEILRLRKIRLGAQLSKVIVDKYTEVRVTPSRKNDPTWGSKLPKSGICSCRYQSPEEIRRSNVDKTKGKPSRPPPRKLTKKQAQALAERKRKEEAEEMAMQRVEAILTPRAVKYISELERDGHLNSGAISWLGTSPGRN